jgi:glycerol dehydrogenase
LVSGGKQLAIAHSFYSSICAYFGDIRERFLHGELVSAAIPFQLAVNGASDDEVNSTKDFLRSIHLPASFKDIQLESTEGNLQAIVMHISDSVGIQGGTSQKHLRKCMETTLQM